ncbi:MAG: hypothetical protein CO108_23460 [Deltaproteobacteria bacterium CG_4_9_14_3_um_filter_63_12]|nr:MAG: hypothetical protein CO108_23460 [Deltaproteobacteria bacterium CG_4_9_14_3_um_filter_63_12]
MKPFLAVFLMCLVALVADCPRAMAQPLAVGLSQPPTLTPTAVLLSRDELDAMRSALSRSVFVAEASHTPPAPYQQVPLVYDGAVTAIEADGLAFLTAAGWLTDAETIEMLDGDERIELAVEEMDVRVGLALLRLADGTNSAAFTPLSIGALTPMVAYALLSPQTRYEQLVTVSVLNDVAQDLYWQTTLAAVNGYPIVDVDRNLVAVQCLRVPNDPSRGLAVGWPVINLMLDPPDDLAPARRPDHVLGEEEEVEQHAYGWWSPTWGEGPK